MNSPRANFDRIGAYHERVDELTLQKAPSARIKYTLANLALDELKMSVERAEEPTQASFDFVAHQFRLTAKSSKDAFDVYRSHLLRHWIRPIVWSDIINIGTLSSGEAKRVAENIQLGKAADETALLARAALRNYDKLQAQGKVPRVRELISGFLNEITPLLLSTRHTTAKAFAVPTTQFDDAINPVRALRTDAIYFDNRAQRVRKKVPFQVETVSGSHHFIHPSIPVINAHLIGNPTFSSKWPSDDRRFVTLRHLVDERVGDGIDQETSSQLDRINSDLTAAILRKK